MHKGLTTIELQTGHLVPAFSGTASNRSDFTGCSHPCRNNCTQLTMIVHRSLYMFSLHSRLKQDLLLCCPAVWMSRTEWQQWKAFPRISALFDGKYQIQSEALCGSAPPGKPRQCRLLGTHHSSLRMGPVACTQYSLGVFGLLCVLQSFRIHLILHMFVLMMNSRRSGCPVLTPILCT